MSVKNATWINITNLCNIPTIANTTNSSPKINLSEYAGKPLYLAFHYFRPANPNDWPRYQVKNFNVANVADGFTYQTMSTGNAGWSVFDCNAPIGTDPYNSTGGNTNNTTWNIQNASNDSRIYIGYSCKINSDDWVITKNIDLTSVSPDLGTGIKSYSDDKIKEYSQVYNNPGTYTVSFIAINSLYTNSKRVVKELKVKIVN